MVTGDRYAFGDFVLDLAQHRLLQADGTPLNLTPRAVDALALFVARAGELLDKQLLLDALWPGLVVEENNLNQVVHTVRRALGDDGSRFIQTVPRRGFRFVAPVTRLAPGAGPAATGSTSAPAPPAAASPMPSDLPPATAQEAEEPTPPAARRRLLLAGGAAALAGGAALVWQLRRSLAAPPAHLTLAVLPFRSLAPRDDDLLGLGMADSLVARLSLVPGLVVRSVGSTARYAGQPQDPLQAARELDVAWVVDGSLQRQGDRVRATARLLRASDGTSAWTGSFEQPLVDLFEVHDRIASRLAQELAPRLRPEHAGAPVSGPLAAGGTRHTDAYQLYLMAQWGAQLGHPQRIDQAIALLHQALEIDPSFAQAWTMLAWTHRRKMWSADVVPAEIFGPVNLALQRALALVPGLPAARAGQGFSRYWYDFDWTGAERDFRAALAINPSEVAGHHGLGLLLSTQGRVDEGQAHVRTARELDPMSPHFNVFEASYLVDAGRLPEARVRLGRALELAPELWLVHVCEASLRFAERNDEAGLAALQRAVKFGSATTRPRGLLGAQLARLGRQEQARALLAELVAQSRQRFVNPSSIAMVQAALGEREAALASLELAYAVRDVRLIFLKDDPHWHGLRPEPRFLALMQRLNLAGLRPGLTPV